MDYGIIGGADGPTAVFVAGRVGGFNWINFFGLITVLLILLPNIVYAVKCRGEKNLCTKKFLNLLEQVGRYGSMVFSVVYIGTKDGFGFGSVFALFCYLFGNLFLILAYWCTWAVYFKAAGVWRKKQRTAQVKGAEKSDGPTAVFVVGREQVQKISGLKYVLAVLPTLVFLLDGIALWNIPLMICAVLFGIGHIGVTRENIKMSAHGEERSTSDDI